MKQLLLLGAALALVGCSSAPSEGDIEDFLESRFAPCKNIKVVDITKTNGYEQDGYYRVEFAYAIKQKNPDALKDLVRTYEQEKQKLEDWEQTILAHSQRAHDLDKEVRLLEEDHYKTLPKPQHFFGAASPTWAQEQQFSAFVKEWQAQNPPPALIQEKKDLLKQTYDEIDKIRLARPYGKVYQNADSAVMGYYLRGCPLDTRANFIPDIFPQALEARNTQNEQAWFNERALQMKAAVSMHKTENGWRALSGG